VLLMTSGRRWTVMLLPTYTWQWQTSFYQASQRKRRQRRFGIHSRTFMRSSQWPTRYSSRGGSILIV
ncbi:hypothetical protein PIB30_110548, partial [Stylosanthes scabra]|nr:hypothetical protein [Stylosanthes scabra]